MANRARLFNGIAVGLLILAILAAGAILYYIPQVNQSVNKMWGDISATNEAKQDYDGAARYRKLHLSDGALEDSTRAQVADVLLKLAVVSGVPILLLFLLGWRNSAGVKNEARHQEQLTALRSAPDDAIPAQLQAARALIAAKQYHEARALLLTIDSPQARNWIRQMDRRRL
jgi:hypothetical protein